MDFVTCDMVMEIHNSMSEKSDVTGSVCKLLKSLTQSTILVSSSFQRGKMSILIYISESLNLFFLKCSFFGFFW